MNEDLAKLLEQFWEDYCEHLKEVAHELKLKAEAGDLSEDVLYAELLNAFNMGKDAE